jgi:hypothetical protein
MVNTIFFPIPPGADLFEPEDPLLIYSSSSLVALGARRAG